MIPDFGPRGTPETFRASDKRAVDNANIPGTLLLDPPHISLGFESPKKQVEDSGSFAFGPLDSTRFLREDRLPVSGVPKMQVT